MYQCTRLVIFSPAINGSPEQCLPSSFTGIIVPIAKLNKFSTFPLLQITNPTPAGPPRRVECNIRKPNYLVKSVICCRPLSLLIPFVNPLEWSSVSSLFFDRHSMRIKLSSAVLPRPLPAASGRREMVRTRIALIFHLHSNGGP